MSVFKANPEELRAKGSQMIDYASQFETNVRKIYSTIQEMIHSNYTSPDAIALANEIEKHHNDMNRMAKIIDNYGQFLTNYGNAVIRNQMNNITNMNIE